ncbi:HAD hydrolase-like protein [Lichenibacterium ramalinae]|uniref:HAD family hydrolase n=1 Tax=Lichenibacterium ramalinae TaxID=2316527 RepID=A0A4Q2R9Q0_9HYPH|nr:HAD hydrolase-like protein [Lichenibacterium ramalinae]RYB02254.1 HAD family hydrolase [Lichenibacterium ramalinae]
MRPPSSVLLDLDGTLVDSKPGIVASYDAALRDLGHVPDPGFDLTFVIGPVLGDVMGEVLAHYGDTRVDEAIAAYRRHYGETGIFGVAPYEGVPALLDTLRAGGAALYLATSKRTAFAARILEHLGLIGHFAGVYGSEPDGFRDHKPELIADIVKRHGLRPDESVMVGDRRYDVVGAHANGLRAVGALWGYGGREELEAAGVDLLADSPAALARLLA